MKGVDECSVDDAILSTDVVSDVAPSLGEMLGILCC